MGTKIGLISHICPKRFMTMLVLAACLACSAQYAFAAAQDFEPVEKGLIEKQENMEREQREQKEAVEREQREQKEAAEREQRDQKAAMERRNRMQQMLQNEKVSIAISYKSFTPQNSSMSKASGAAAGYSLSADIYKYATIGVDTWANGQPKAAGVNNLSGRALFLYGKYPYNINPYFALYAGFGGRFESMSVNDGDATYGNNAALVVFGVRMRFNETFGIEANAGMTVGAKNTDYTISGVGLLYAF